jgi:Dihydrodipicolinate synthetase family
VNHYVYCKSMMNQNAYGGMYMVKNEIKRLAGVYPIISTPFTEDGGLDLHSLERLSNFMCQSGVQGAVYPAIASEFSTLTKSERHNAVSLVAQTTNAFDLLLEFLTTPPISQLLMLSRQRNSKQMQSCLCHPAQQVIPQMM